MLNQARLKTLKVREDHVRNVLEEARKRLGEVIRNPAQYREILQLLIIQGLYQVIFFYSFNYSYCVLLNILFGPINVSLWHNLYFYS